MFHAFYTESHFPAINNAVADFVSERIWGEPGHFERYCTMAVTDSEGRLIAGIVYHNWHEETGVIELSAGSSSHRWMSREIVRAFLSMPFEALGCQVIAARYSAGDNPQGRIWRSFGATEYVIPRLRGKDQPAEVVSVLTDDAWARSRFNCPERAEV